MVFHQKYITGNPNDGRWGSYLDMSASQLERHYADRYNDLRRNLTIVDGELVPRDMDTYRLQKAIMNSSDTGTFALMYGAAAALQLSKIQNTLAMLPKKGYPRGGFRVRSTRGISSSTGQAEGASVPTAIEATYNEVDGTLKEVFQALDISLRLLVIMGKNDSITFDQAVADFVNDCLFGTNADLLEDVDTLASNDFESIDRYTQASTAQSGIGFTAGDEDWMGVDRSTSTWFDSYINHNSDTDRPLNTDHIKSLFRNCHDRWNDLANKVYLAGVALIDKWGTLEEGKHRLDQLPVEFTYASGVQPAVGQAGGFRLHHWEGRPIIHDAVQDSGRRLYLLDLDHLGVVEGRPMEVIHGDNIVYVGAAKQQAVFYWIADLWGDLPPGSGQLRDISS